MNCTTLIGAKTLDGSIKNWMNNSLIPSTVVLQMAEAFIYRRLRVREMLATSTSLTFTIGQSTVTLPDRYLANKLFQITGPSGSWELKEAEVEGVERGLQFDDAGALIDAPPECFYAGATTFQLNAPSDQAYTSRLTFFQQPAPLAASTNETNFLTDKFVTLLTYACLMAGNQFMKDDNEKTYWQTLALAEIAEINAEDRMNKTANWQMEPD